MGNFLNACTENEVFKKNPFATLDTALCPLTTKLHPGWRGRVQITSAGQRSEIAVDQIRTVSKRRSVRRPGKITAKSVAELQRAISEIYGEGWERVRKVSCSKGSHSEGA